MSAAAFFARWRVRLSYPLAAVVLWFARPSPKSIVAGALVGNKDNSQPVFARFNDFYIVFLAFVNDVALC